MKIKRIILIAVIATIAIFLLISVVQPWKCTGKEWLEEQGQYITEFEEYADTMDSILSLYVTGNLTQEAFLEHLDALNDELLIMQAGYNTAKEDHPVKVGTHTYATKKGSESVEKCYGIFQDMIHMEQQEYQDVDTLSYKYLAYQQKLVDCMSDYMACIQEAGIPSAGEEDNQ